jgi:hypothetical protein
MTNAVILEKVAGREITPEQGAALMLEADREARAKQRPAWMPSWAWVAGSVVVALLFAVVGVRKD